MRGFGVGQKAPASEAAATKAKEKREGGVKPPLHGELCPIGKAMRVRAAESCIGLIGYRNGGALGQASRWRA
jgi:hypothetical protein